MALEDSLNRIADSLDSLVEIGIELLGFFDETVKEELAEAMRSRLDSDELRRVIAMSTRQELLNIARHLEIRTSNSAHNKHLVNLIYQQMLSDEIKQDEGRTTKEILNFAAIRYRDIRDKLRADPKTKSGPDDYFTIFRIFCDNHGEEALIKLIRETNSGASKASHLTATETQHLRKLVQDYSAK